MDIKLRGAECPFCRKVNLIDGPKSHHERGQIDCESCGSNFEFYARCSVAISRKEDKGTGNFLDFRWCGVSVEPETNKVKTIKLKDET